MQCLSKRVVPFTPDCARCRSYFAVAQLLKKSLYIWLHLLSNSSHHDIRRNKSSGFAWWPIRSFGFVSNLLGWLCPAYYDENGIKFKILHYLFRQKCSFVLKCARCYIGFRISTSARSRTRLESYDTTAGTPVSWGWR